MIDAQRGINIKRSLDKDFQTKEEHMATHSKNNPRGVKGRGEAEAESLYRRRESNNCKNKRKERNGMSTPVHVP